MLETHPLNVGLDPSRTAGEEPLLKRPLREVRQLVHTSGANT